VLVLLLILVRNFNANMNRNDLGVLDIWSSGHFYQLASLGKAWIAPPCGTGSPLGIS
jgi:hypothetical protein